MPGQGRFDVTGVRQCILVRGAARPSAAERSVFDARVALVATTIAGCAQCQGPLTRQMRSVNRWESPLLAGEDDSEHLEATHDVPHDGGLAPSAGYLLSANTAARSC